jgi:hypothetical protein
MRKGGRAGGWADAVYATSSMIHCSPEIKQTDVLQFSSLNAHGPNSPFILINDFSLFAFDRSVCVSGTRVAICIRAVARTRLHATIKSRISGAGECRLLGCDAVWLF